ncbi:hypothetical protein AAG906_017207 [Vitis piasezkii]
MIYHSLVDTTNIPKTTDYIFSLIDKVLEEVGEENVVQVVTDNEASFKAAGMLLMEKRKYLCWFPCAAHCIDLMLEDIASMKQIKETLDQAKMIIGFIYNSLKVGEVQTIMEPLVKVLKLVDQDKKPTLSIIYEAMDRAKLVIKASVNQWEKYWELIDRRWEGQLHKHLHIAVRLKEVIKILKPDLDRQAKVKLFVEGQGEFGSALTKKIINQSLLDEWIQEGEELILSSDNLDWLDKGLPTNEEGRERDVDSRHKGKASRTISSSSSNDDGDNGVTRWDGGTSEGNRGILACHRHKEVKITMPHKIQVMDIDQGYGNNESIWKD